jgi:hypothetical protein
MVDIPITATERKAQFTGNTGLGPFAFTFNVLNETDITVIKNAEELILTSEYTVFTNADGTGSVTLTGSGDGTALVSSDVLTILGDRPIARESDYLDGASLFSASINEDLDSIVILLQQLDEKISRAVRVGAGDVIGSFEIPDKATRLGKYLAFDATTGDPIAYETIAERITVSTSSPSGGSDGDLWFKLAN